MHKQRLKYLGIVVIMGVSFLLLGGGTLTISIKNQDIHGCGGSAPPSVSHTETNSCALPPSTVFVPVTMGNCKSYTLAPWSPGFTYTYSYTDTGFYASDDTIITFRADCAGERKIADCSIMPTPTPTQDSWSPAIVLIENGQVAPGIEQLSADQVSQRCSGPYTDGMGGTCSASAPYYCASTRSCVKTCASCGTTTNFPPIGSPPTACTCR
jgi:hypothetical protein